MFPRRLSGAYPWLHIPGTESVCPSPLQLEEGPAFKAKLNLLKRYRSILDINKIAFSFILFMKLSLSISLFQKKRIS